MTLQQLILVVFKFVLFDGFCGVMQSDGDDHHDSCFCERLATFPFLCIKIISPGVIMAVQTDMFILLQGESTGLKAQVMVLFTRS